nr:unnamed protein product [Pongo abelii]
MAALSCLLDSVRRDIKKVDRELRQLRCIDEFSTRCLCDLYMHPYCCCDLHPYPYCLCYSKRSRSCGLCDLYPCCLCDYKLYCLRPSLRSLERKAIRAIEDEKRELAKLRRTTNRILASSCCSSNILGSVNVCGFEPDQVKVRVKDGKDLPKTFLKPLSCDGRDMELEDKGHHLKRFSTGNHDQELALCQAETAVWHAFSFLILTVALRG